MKSFSTEFLFRCGAFTAQLLLAMVVVVSVSADLKAQGVGGTRGLPSTSGGIHTIQGRIYSPSGTAVSGTLKVRLDSPNTGTLETVTDRDGTFTFPRVEAGDYR